eukprot:TRINITY_DN410_c1_g2_i1.p1 TRINITY_DN410_c1_g2~~TRINITY_DN410_c1_g2_i1.p1  ORF type:complete len:424 (+),score=55.74 TRINITY_DN410_c1_g2_i1:2039-3310(+)
MNVIELGDDETLCKQACQCLCEEWPGVPMDTRLERIHNKKEGRTLGLIVDQNGTPTCVGTARIQNAKETGEGLACAVTSVVISSKHRNKGYGTQLMEGLTTYAKEQGYTYIYLWTSTAKDFYEKCGYMFCQRINLDKPVLRKFNQTAIAALESMLSQRQNKMDAATMDNIDNPREGDNVVWMRKRLVQEMPSQTRSDEELHTLIEASCKPIMQLKQRFTYYCNNVPWQKQVGPSCGLAALRMVKEFHKQNLPQTKSLLDTAVERKYSTDGEIFNIDDLKQLAVDVLQFEDCSIIDTSTEDIVSFFQTIINSGKLIVLPYDREPGTSLPTLYQGVYSHYCVLFGYGYIDEGETPCERSNEPLQRPSELYLLAQHGMSPCPVIDTSEKWVSSNNNLNPTDKTMNKYTVIEGEKKVANLCGKCLAI